MQQCQLLVRQPALTEWESTNCSPMRSMAMALIVKSRRRRSCSNVPGSTLGILSGNRVDPAEADAKSTGIPSEAQCDCPVIPVMLHIRDPLRTTAPQQRRIQGNDIPLDNPIQIGNTSPWNTMQLMQQQVSNHATRGPASSHLHILSGTGATHSLVMAAFTRQIQCVVLKSTTQSSRICMGLTL